MSKWIKNYKENKLGDEFDSDNIIIHLIGADTRGKASNFKDTLYQIECVKRHVLSLSDTSGKPLVWSDLDDIQNKYTLMQTILYDRKLRIDSNTIMADRPPFCVFTVHENRIVRLEYYQGHDSLQLIYDIRAYEFYGLKMAVFLPYDKSAYDLSEDPVTKFFNAKYDKIIAKKIEHFFRLLHDEQLRINCKMYQARSSVILKEHQAFIRALLRSPDFKRGCHQINGGR